MHWALCGGVALAGLAGLPGGCAAPAAPDPEAVVLDAEASLARRRAALDVLIERPADPAAQRALHAVLWSDRQPVEMRLAALSSLARQDAGALSAVTRRRVVEVDRWEVLGPLLERGAEAGWPGWSAVVVRSWSRPSQVYADADRPERAILERLAPGGEVTGALQAFVAGRWGYGDLGERVAAWELLSRLTDATQRRAWLRNESSGDLLMSALRDAAASLGELPATRQQVLWLLAVPRLPAPLDDPATGPALRHLSVYGQNVPSRSALLANVRARLAPAPAFQRTETGMMRDTPVDESFAAHADRLSRGDLLLIARLLDVLGDPAVVEELFRQADADHVDRSSEHGGVLRLRPGGRPEAVAFEPMIRQHDHVFIPPTELITAMYGGLAHYHFHAQSHDNEGFAGPGAGDLAFADRFGAACLVLTFVDRDTLNADYYQPGGAVVDLGVIRRAGPTTPF